MRFILIHIGLPIEVTNWIIGCVTFASCVVLINGSPSSFFYGSRGIHHGYPLYLVLSLLDIEGLSRLIIKAKSDGKVKGIKISNALFISHLLFVDDVLIFGCGTKAEWEVFKSLLEAFCEASSLNISPHKYSFLVNYSDNRIRDQISLMFPFHMDKIDQV